MKTYSNSEVLALLEENPSLKFESKTGERIFKLYVEDNRIKNISDRGLDSGFLLNDRWTLKQEPVTFIEAINSGKRICCEGIEEHKEKYFSITETLKAMVFLGEKVAVGMINSKWYIESEQENADQSR